MSDAQPRRHGPASARQPGLLDMPPAVLEAILGSLVQQQRQEVIPLVCRQLAELVRSSSSLFRCYALGDCADRSLPRMLDWFQARRSAVRQLRMIAGETSETSPETFSAVLWLLREHLRRLDILVRETSASLLQPIGSAVQLEHLAVAQHELQQAPPPMTLPHLDRLTALTSLTWCLESSGPPRGLTALTQLAKLHLRNVRGAELGPALRLMRQLDTLSINGFVSGVREVLDALPALTAVEYLTLLRARDVAMPAAVAAMTQLTTLHLLPVDSEVGAELHQLSALSKLKDLLLSCTPLEAPPAWLSALSSLSSLDLAGNPGMRPGEQEMDALLRGLPSLRVLVLDETASRAMDCSSWVRLGRKYPLFELDERVELEE